jgi:Cell Wall Hydrolase
LFGRFRARLVMAAAIALSFLSAAPAMAAGAGSGAATPDLSGLAPAVAAPPVVAPETRPAPTLADLVRTAPTAASAAAATPPPPLTLAGRTLHDLVISYVNFGKQDAEQLCLAKAIYFEARGETLEGQLAVAEVVLNRARSGRYPPTICAVVTQPAQFSFIRGGRFPAVDPTSDCWKKALAISEIASKHLATSLAPNVLWYHATYVAPAWGRQKTRAAQIGTHIFYS